MAVGSPGTTTAPLRSTRFVLQLARGRISSSQPTARIRPSTMARASTGARCRSIVRMVPPVRIRSAPERGVHARMIRRPNQMGIKSKNRMGCRLVIGRRVSQVPLENICCGD